SLHHAVYVAGQTADTQGVASPGSHQPFYYPGNAFGMTTDIFWLSGILREIWYGLLILAGREKTGSVISPLITGATLCSAVIPAAIPTSPHQTHFSSIRPPFRAQQILIMYWPNFRLRAYCFGVLILAVAETACIQA